MSEYILLTLKNKSKVKYKKFYWTSGSNNKSISYYLNKNKEYYVRKYLNITKEIEKNLSKKKNINFEGYNLVKFSYISEHCIYTTPHIIDILKVLVLLDQIKNYKNEIVQIDTNIENTQIKNFFKKNFEHNNCKIIFTEKKIFFKLSFFVPEIVKSTILFSILFFLNFRFINQKKIFKDKYYFISYFSRKNLSANDNFKIFFGDLFKLLKKLKIKYSLIFHALQDNLPDSKKIKNYKNENAIFYRAELNLKDYLIAYYEHLNVFFKIINLNKNKIFYNTKLNINFYPLFENQYKKSFYGVKCPETILNIICTKKLIDKIPSGSKIFYVAENQSWEKFLINESRKKNIYIYGTVHSLVNKWDLRFNDVFSEKKFSPTKLLINGRYNKSIIDSFIKKYPYNYVEALRYNSLKKNQISNRNVSKKNILICGSIEINPTIKMLEEISKSKKIISNYNLLFKSHPANQVDLSKYNFLNPYNKNDNYFLTIGPDPTSIIVDFYLRGIPYITYLSDEYVNSNFFKILKTNLFFTNFLKLEEIVFNKKIKLNKNKNYAIFFIDQKLNLWRKFLNKLK